MCSAGNPPWQRAPVAKKKIQSPSLALSARTQTGRVLHAALGSARSRAPPRHQARRASPPRHAGLRSKSPPRLQAATGSASKPGAVASASRPVRAGATSPPVHAVATSSAVRASATSPPVSVGAASPPGRTGRSLRLHIGPHQARRHLHLVGQVRPLILLPNQ